MEKHQQKKNLTKNKKMQGKILINTYEKSFIKFYCERCGSLVKETALEKHLNCLNEFGELSVTGVCVDFIPERIPETEPARNNNSLKRKNNSGDSINAVDITNEEFINKELISETFLKKNFDNTQDTIDMPNLNKELVNKEMSTETFLKKIFDNSKNTINMSKSNKELDDILSIYLVGTQ